MKEEAEKQLQMDLGLFQGKSLRSDGVMARR